MLVKGLVLQQRRQNILVVLVGLLGLVVILAVSQVTSWTPEERQVARGVEYFQDENGQLSLTDIMSLPKDAWSVEQSDQLTYGMSSNPFWFKFRIDPSASIQPRLMEIDYPLLDGLDIWFLQGDNLLASYQSGDMRPFANREFRHEKFVFAIPQSNHSVYVVVRVVTSGTIKLPVRIWKEQDFSVFIAEHSMVMGLFFGFLAAMGISNLFLFITTGTKTFIYYSGYVFCLALTLATLHGLAFKYLWPDSVWAQERALSVFANGTLFFAVLFSATVLKVQQHSQLIDQAMKVIAAVFLTSCFASLVLPYSALIKFFLVGVSVAALFIYAVGIWLSIKKVALARLYTLAWTGLFLGAFVISLDNLGVVKLYTSSHYLLMFGAAVETFILAVVLALSYSQQGQELLDAQEHALMQERQARTAQEKVIAVQQEAREELEYKVQERTLELEVALRELSESNRELEKKNTIDSLSGIRNRRYFDKKYIAEVRRSRREHTELTIVMLDIDHFKQVNDRYGHLAGDECIRFVAQMLQNSLKRPTDDVCRYGGEEFALILPNTDLAGAVQLIEVVRHKIEKSSIPTSAGELNITLSAGVCSAVIVSSEDEQKLLHRADQNLYTAKHNGRNRTVASPIVLETPVT